MRRKRVLTLIAVFAVIGAIVNFMIAQCAGWWSSVGPKERYFFIPFEGEAAEVGERYGFGRTEFTWRLLPEFGAAIWQDIHQFGPKGPETRRGKPDYAPEWVMPT